MKNLLRNPEVKKTLLIHLSLTAVATVCAFFLKIGFALFTLAVSLCFVLIYLIATANRYKRIASLSEDINRILHGNSHISFDRFSEGELGILQSEIYKMTVRLREQEQRLLEDNLFLVDSIADISHQIRTPLTSINLILSFLREDGITDERRQELIRELYSLLSRIDFLITTLLKISRLDAGTVHFKKEVLSLSELIKKASAPLLIPMELKEQTLTVNAEGDYYGDILWTTEAITNIIKNCHEHTPDGGRITIEASENALFSEIVISDNGKGISEEDLPHIFERFYKGKHSDDKSFGIGLNLSRIIITAEGGTVKAENISPNGARFTIRVYKGTV